MNQPGYDGDELMMVLLRTGMLGSVREKMENARLGNGTHIVLAEKQTRRRDPLDSFNYYTGGWNITNKHYFAVRFLQSSSYNSCYWFQNDSESFEFLPCSPLLLVLFLS